MSLISVDVEADGPCPGLYSMVSFGAVCVDNIARTFYGTTAPISDNFIQDALSVSGVTREQHLGYSNPLDTMNAFADWLNDNSRGRPVFISDNPAFDWQFINYYFHAYIGGNPFGFSARRIGDVYSGLVKDMRQASRWKHMRKTRHTHNPVDDAKGNAEALIEMKRLGLRL